MIEFEKLPSGITQKHFKSLESELKTYLNKDDIHRVYQAFVVGANAHVKQFRKSGEPYITHPLSVAKILAQMHLDVSTLCAAILHDVIEDTLISKEDLSDAFGVTVAELVDGVSKLGQMENLTKEEAQAASFGKMMVAMVKDVRVILIKLADRLHNMQTLDVMRPDKKRRIARETLEIYVPIAYRLGIRWIRQELEDLSFRAIYPWRYAVLEAAQRRFWGDQQDLLEDMEQAISVRLDELSVDARVTGRVKRLYSLYGKMHRKHVGFKGVFDMFALRVEVETEDECYRALGAIHSLYKLYPGRFKDYIAMPKANGYQSLHTSVYGPNRRPIEVQIRTRAMHEFAEKGIASHWTYKHDDDEMDSAAQAQIRSQRWLNRLQELQEHSSSHSEFLEQVKIDLFPEEVYVFTPKGDVITLPRNATPVDFAYAVHTDIGDHCEQAIVDDMFVDLSIPLKSGQVVQILTSPYTHPRPTWLEFVVTARAISRIRHFQNNLRRGDAIDLGRRLLTRSLGGEHLERFLADDESHLRPLVEHYQLDSVNTLYFEIGSGHRPVKLVINMLKELIDTPEDEAQDMMQSIQIHGTEGMVISYAKCCHPIPGDRTMGQISAGRGIVVHRGQCKHVQDAKQHPERWVETSWSADVEGVFEAALRVHMGNYRGGLAKIAESISSAGADIQKVHFDDSQTQTASILFHLGVRDRVHLADVIRHIRHNQRVQKVSRVMN